MMHRQHGSIIIADYIVSQSRTVMTTIVMILCAFIVGACDSLQANTELSRSNSQHNEHSIDQIKIALPILKKGGAIGLPNPIEIPVLPNPDMISYGLTGFDNFKLTGYQDYYRYPSQPVAMMFSLLTSLASAQRFDLACMVDYLQVPCDNDSNAYKYSVIVEPEKRSDFPVIVTPSGRGVHDVVVVFEQDPMLESSNERAFRDTKHYRTNVEVESELVPTMASYVETEGDPGTGSIEYGVFVSDRYEARDEIGGWPRAR